MALKYSRDEYKRIDPKKYLDGYYTRPQSNDEGYQLFYFKGQHDFWSRFPNCSSSQTSMDPVRCLEYGGGPVVAGLISATPKVDHIVFAEFAEVHRQAVLSWKAGDSKSHNWKPLIKHVVVDIENDNTPQAVVNREQELKHKLKSVVSCDINRTPIVDLEDQDSGKLFDVISTRLCLEACVTSNEHYKSSVFKLCQLLKPNGYLFMNGVLGETFHTIDKQRCYSFPLTKSLVEEAMKEAQLVDINIVTMTPVNLGELSDFQSTYIAYGRKAEK